ncbi:uncharacterized protein ARMOST_18415 [Armillaria ostoyae]|uniref:Uncharacterized protein n=1 Tax=Armillaria ostoyae TaxID=47428 RepID=A0A284S1R8_ARMOS|nr:uncharacterized protein ARMOST_18415 [Armillaria ostoyae]
MDALFEIPKIAPLGVAGTAIQRPASGQPFHVSRCCDTGHRSARLGTDLMRQQGRHWPTALSPKAPCFSRFVQFLLRLVDIESLERISRMEFCKDHVSLEPMKNSYREPSMRLFSLVPRQRN